MNTNIIILITVAVCLVVFNGITFGALLLAKHRVDATTVVNDVSKGINYAQSISTAIKPFLPTIAGNVIDVTLKYAAQAVARVEATYKAALLTDASANDTRTAEAKSMITSALAMEGVPMSNDVEKLIDTVIPRLVMALPKTHEDTVSMEHGTEDTETTTIKSDEVKVTQVA